MKIHRYIIAPTVEIPTGAVFLNAQPGSSGISAWFICDPAAALETRKFAIIATGQELPDAILDCQHLATLKAAVVTTEGPIPTALHLFDTTHVKAEIPSINLGEKQSSTDPADWWKA